jgi:sulfopyruvate decarboxylase subunit alpha
VAIEALARLGIGHGIPVLMIMPFRGDLGDKDWWAQAHGTTMKPLLEAMRIPYRVVEHEEEIVPTITNAWETLYSSKYPVAVIIGGRLCL